MTDDFDREHDFWEMESVKISIRKQLDDLTKLREVPFRKVGDESNGHREVSSPPMADKERNLYIGKHISV
jgi:hypothetical protein